MSDGAFGLLVQGVSEAMRDRKEYERVLKIGALFPFLTLLEYMFLGTWFSFLGLVGVFFIVGRVRCKTCKTPIYDSRVASKINSFSLEVLDSCPVCRSPMV
jgi:hypothetical protein